MASFDKRIYIQCNLLGSKNRSRASDVAECLSLRPVHDLAQSLCHRLLLPSPLDGATTHRLSKGTTTMCIQCNLLSSNGRFRASDVTEHLSLQHVPALCIGRLLSSPFRLLNLIAAIHGVQQHTTHHTWIKNRRKGSKLTTPRVPCQDEAPVSSRYTSPFWLGV